MTLCRVERIPHTPSAPETTPRKVQRTSRIRLTHQQEHCAKSKGADQKSSATKKHTTTDRPVRHISFQNQLFDNSQAVLAYLE
jgi:hypothetical protein